MNKDNLNKNQSRIIVTVTAIAMAIIVIFCCVYTQSHDIETDPNNPLLVRGASRHLKTMYRFNDDNNAHLAAGQKYGIQPLASRDKLDSSIINKLEKVESSKVYRVDSLTHSVPYLTPGAYDLLNTLATKFQSKLQKQGFTQYKFIVTSMLRTEDDVKRLMKVNRNATKQSSHMYATTFDITYSRFEKVDSKPDFTGKDASYKDIINILGESLKELRDDNKCYAIIERGQPCYHITVRY